MTFPFMKLLACLLLPAALLAAEENEIHSADLESQIKSLRKELTQIQTQRQKNKQDMESEQRDLATYRDRTAKRLSNAQAQIDSTKNEIASTQKRSDSLSSLIHSAQSEKRNIDLSREALANRIAASCEVLDRQAVRLPSQIQGQIRSSIALVKSDLMSKTIESPEAFSRLAQVINLMRDATSSIQTGSEKSPVADIAGTATRLRIGCVMDAVADPKGTSCYLWTGNNPDGTPLWKAADDKSAAGEVVHAVAVREGKALPSFVNLPLTSVPKEAKQ